MKSLKTTISKPDNKSRLWALWIWNNIITPDEIEKQLNSFIDKGFGGVAIRPGREMFPTYLSEEFFDLFKQVLDIAKHNHILVRIADDFSLPWSGFFQSHAEQNTSYRAQKLILNDKVVLNVGDQFDFEMDDVEKYIILAGKLSNGKLNPNSIKLLTSSGKKHSVCLKAANSEWCIMVFKKEWYYDSLGNYLPNVFNPKVAQVYIQFVLERFKSKFPKSIPSTLEGFICEMPTYLPFEDCIPWDDDLIIKYKSRYKKNLVDVLPTLFFDVDDAYAKNRSHVYTFIIQAMYERFPVVLETWAKKYRFSQWVLCPERNIEWTENTLRDVMTIPTAQLSSVGIQNQEGTEKNYTIACSIADINTIEHHRETIGVIGRNRQGTCATLQTLKTEIDHHAFVGTSKILLDGCFFNLDHKSYLKTPFNMSWYHPDWEFMGSLSEYAARMLSLSHNHQKNCPIAVVLPASSIMADYLPNNDESVRKGMLVFKKVIDSLLAKNVEFDIVSEQFLITCAVKTNGEFGTSDRVRKGNYQAVIFPFSRLINNSVFVFLEKLVTKKGTVVFIDEAPQGNFDDGQSSSFSNRIARLTRPKNTTVHVAPASSFVSKLTNIEQLVKITSNGKDCPYIHSTSYLEQTYTVHMFHNNSLKRDYFTTIEIPDIAHVYYIDCADGEFYEMESVTHQDEITLIELDFAPKQTHVLAVSATKILGIANKGDKHYINLYGSSNRNYRVVLKDRYSFKPLSYNAMPLASLTKRIGLSRDSGGFSHYYETYFEVDDVPQTSLLAFLNRTNNNNMLNSSDRGYEVSVNGILVKPFKVRDDIADEERDFPFENFCGYTLLKYDIKDAIMKGINRVSIRTIGLEIEPESINYPPIVAGDFAIKKGSRGWTIHSSNGEANYGSWTKHGFPYLSGSGEYKQIFEVPADYNRIVLRLNHISGSVTAEINDVKLGTALWQPVGFDITGIVEPRRNVLKINIRNTIENILKMNGRASGLIGEVYLDIY